MELNQLKYFKAVAEYGSISRAAEALYISQPALSKVIGRLESEVGVKLFERTNSGMQLNLNGVRMLQCANTIFSELDKCTADLKNNAKRRITIMASKDYGWDAELDQIQALHPDLSISYTCADASACLEAVRRERCTIAIIECQPDTAAGAAVLYPLKWCVIAHRDHPLAAGGAVSLPALADALISIGCDRDLSHATELFRLNGIVPKTFLNADSKGPDAPKENYINRCMAVGIVPYDIFYTLKMRSPHTPICAVPIAETDRMPPWAACIFCRTGFPDTPEEADLLTSITQNLQSYWERVVTRTEAYMAVCRTPSTPDDESWYINGKS